MSAGTESSTIGASIGPPPVTSYDIINIKWLSEDVYLRKSVRGIEVAYFLKLKFVVHELEYIDQLLSFNRSLYYNSVKFISTNLQELETSLFFARAALLVKNRQ